MTRGTSFVVTAVAAALVIALAAAQPRALAQSPSAHQHRFTDAGRVQAELKSAGFALVQEHGFLPNQYFLVFRADARGR